MRWIVTSISLLKPIRYMSVRRNEVQSKLSPTSVKRWMKDPSAYEPQIAGAGFNTDSTPRNSLLLRDVSYVIEAHPRIYSADPANTPMKYISMLLRRAEKGQCYQQPALGCREFAANFEPANDSDRPVPQDEDIGRMLYDVVFRPGGNRPVFFNAQLRGGIMNTHPEEVLTDPAVRGEVLECSYKR